MNTAFAIAFWVVLFVGGYVLLRTRAAGKIQALRVPLLLWAVSTAIPVLAIGDVGFARGLFWVPRGGAFGLCTLVFFIGWQCLFLERLIRCCGAERFPVLGLRCAGEPKWWEYVFSSIPGLCTVAAIVTVSGLEQKSDSIGWLIAGMVAGFAFAAALVLAAVFIQHLSASEGTSVLRLTPHFGFLKNALARRPPKWLDRLADSISRAIGRLVSFADKEGTGFWTESERGKRSVHDGHVAAAVMSFIAALLALIYFVGYHYSIGWLRGGIPAAVYLYLALTLIGWIVSGLAFLLDGFGTPTLTVLAAWAWLITWNPFNQHYFPVISPANLPPPASPATVARSHQKNGQQRWIIVSADGGGIQAAAWSTQVLGGLASEFGADFGNAIALMSGVSGGSAGLMFFQTLYDQGGFKDDAVKIEEVIKAGQSDTLSDVAFGMTFYDLTRPLIPYLAFASNDRGNMLEIAWQRALEKLGARGDLTMGQLRNGVAEGKRPVLLFNSTIADTGQAFVFSNASFPEWRSGSARTFQHLYQDKDIRLVTAARMSATFPFVSPTAKAAENNRPLETPALSFVDGGYYDNYGVVNALAWLRDAAVGQREAGDSAKPQVLWLQIRSSPGPKDGEKEAGLATSVVGPVWSLYQTRGAAQRSRAEQLNQMVVAAADDLNVDIVIPQPFEFPNTDVPLSWVLTHRERDNIGAEWRKMKQGGSCSIQQVGQFVRGEKVAACK